MVMRGDWGEVWGAFDKRKKKTANDSGLTEALDEADMFEEAGVAAELRNG